MKRLLALFTLAFLLSLTFLSATNYVYSPTPITLQTGDNYFGAVFNESANITNKTILLYVGQNLIGVSSRNNISLDSINFNNGTIYSYAEAKDAGLITSINLTSGPEVTNLQGMSAVWVYATSNCNMTFQNVGGSQVGDTFPLANVKFSNGTDELSITQAVTAGWTNGLVYGWDPNNCIGNNCWQLMDQDILPIFNSWYGYRINSNLNNIQMIFDEGRTEIPPQPAAQTTLDPLTTSILKVVILIVALIIVIVSLILLMISLKNNFSGITTKQIMNYLIFILITLSLGLAVMNQITIVISGGS